MAKAQQNDGGMIAEAAAVRLLATTSVALKRAVKWGYVPKAVRGSYPIASVVNGFSLYLASGEMTVKEAGELIGTSDEWVRRLIADGYLTRNDRGNVVRDDVVKGYIRFLKDDDRRSTKTAAESRVRDARAAEIEMRIAEKRRDLIDTDDVIAACDKIVGVVRTEMIGLPARVTREKALRRQIEDQVHGSLNRIAGSLREVADALRTGRDVLGADAEGDT